MSSELDAETCFRRAERLHNKALLVQPSDDTSEWADQLELPAELAEVPSDDLMPALWKVAVAYSLSHFMSEGEGLR